ncbi:MAG: glycoside hydrolase family 3 N-terminal domain-containing protein [Candidatus Sulfobium sp.]|jgi:beta-glucosidase-like glycosyl hydrolase
MENYYRLIVPRLNGDEISSKSGYYLSLVRKGIAGFIIFGGQLEETREFIMRLQEESTLPLIISSDLERGLGQQIKGGTPFPPAMALASATRRRRKDGIILLRKAFEALAAESAYAGINTIFAPVLDINTNPENPIIAARAFGEDSDTVSLFGCEMVRALQRCGIAACGKHFPGHGDTGTDSHIGLPLISRSMQALKRQELKPFRRAISAGVKMMMMGHLSVPAIDPSGIPLSVSGKAVSFLRREMKFRGIVITDAMDMGGLGKFSEEEASLMALNAGVDILLHPSDPEKIVDHLGKKRAAFHPRRLDRFRAGLKQIRSGTAPPFDEHLALSRELTGRAISISGGIGRREKTFVVILNDEEEEKGAVFRRRLKANLGDVGFRTLRRTSGAQRISLPREAFTVVAIFSETRAWKGGASSWLHDRLSYMADKADLLVSFGSPYLLPHLKKTARMYAYWDDSTAQEAAADVIARKFSGKS